MSSSPASSVFSRWTPWWSTGIVCLLLVILYLGAVWVRTESFKSRGHRHDEQFWVESAQHYRNVRMVADGGTIPHLDIDLEYPDGLETRSHTIHGEYAIGLIARHLPFESISRFAHTHALFGVYLDRLLEPFFPVRTPTVAAFVRYFVRLSISTIVFWIFLATWEVTRDRWGSLLAAALYAFSFGGISRSLGDTFYHEHVALPLLGIHLWFTCRALKRDAWGDILGCVLFLIGALLTWKVIEFYFLVFILYFFWMYLTIGLDKRSYRLLIAVTAGVFLTSVLLDVHLRYSWFYISRGMVASYAILLASLVQRHKGDHWKWSVLPLLLILLGGKMLLIPDTGRYTHVWETFFYRLWYLHKPLDPSLLPFDVRHYWVPPYTSPNLFAFLNEVFWSIILALPAVGAAVGYQLLPRGWRLHADSPQKRCEAFLLLGFFAFLAFYLMFYKILTFLLLFSLPWVGVLWVRWKDRRLGRIMLGAIALCFLLSALTAALPWGIWGGLSIGMVLLLVWAALWYYRQSLPMRAGLLILVLFAIASQAYQTVAWNRSWLVQGMFRIGLRPSQEKDTGSVVPGYYIHDIIEWAKTDSEPGEAFLCEFVLSPSLLVYAGRPINQHCFFESDMRLKYEEFSYALYQSEEAFYEFCQKYETTYFIYNAHMLLRDDPNMSFRYITDNMDWNPDWAAYRFHFRPEKLRHFNLVYQNPFLRVFRVLEPGERVNENANRNEPYSPLFDEELFWKVVEHPDGAKAPRADEFLYPAVRSYDRFLRAQALLNSSQPEAQMNGLIELYQAAEETPWIAFISNRLAQVYVALRRPEQARHWYLNTLRWHPNDGVALRGLEALEGADNQALTVPDRL